MAGSLQVRAVETVSRQFMALLCAFLLEGYVCMYVCSYTVRLLSFRSDCAERILRTPSGGHPQKHVGASFDTLCA
jgi:hypothetical protein